ncbi:hypothetical protein J3B02_000542 [Coemansia erecta]|uniref:Aminopeptidase n=1 Tax=Coemansia asiatica TaxID=1052880 RepID=A0A9W7XLS3_9FUNG|nr:hypothetical protein LPJ64_002354 [Coemansia asiatica]KAJ2858096.1 hypothetical protein J3B02_000542 [Coemansia erecta]KAJ2887909.1 hypothetical protein FB639_001001 [Coemansia asiatica]
MALKPDVSALSAKANNNNNNNNSAVVENEVASSTEEESSDIASGTLTIDDQVPSSSETLSSEPSILDILPTSIWPQHYDIYLNPDIDTGDVSGSVCIEALVTENTKTIAMHAKDISIQRVRLFVNDKYIGELQDNIKYDQSLETVYVSGKRELERDQRIKLLIEYQTRISDSMYGLYRSKYVDRQGSQAMMLVTQFQAKCARMVFPCWDEPKYKAEFSLQLTVPRTHTALSNMPVQRTEDLADTVLKTVSFERSPRMSTYLLALVSGELDYIEQRAPESGILIRIYTAPTDTDKVGFSLETAVRVLDLLVKMFSIAYPLPKLDLVAVPELEAGGMENWGLVLFRTVRLFITKQTSLWIRQKAVYVIAHELSHQWFGNLVTMQWWDDLWLNEGFATWIGIFVTDLMYPEWKRWDHFAIEDRQAALSADSLRSSHPIQVTIKGSADIDQVFDSITYYKGCALIRMLSEHLGIERFMTGVRLYLTRHQFASATTSDLWDALEKTTGESVRLLMHSWTKMVGYPVITVDECFENGRLRLRQSRYLHSGKPTEDEDQVVWWVPLAMISSETKGKVVHRTLQTREACVEIPGGNDVSWVKLNAANAGLYRVCYSANALKRLAAAVARGELSTVDVVGILNDMVALVVSGYMRTSVLLDMIGSFGTVCEYVVWQIIGVFLEGMYLTWADRDQDMRLNIKQLTRSLFGPKAATLGWTHRPDDSPLVARLRAISIPRAAWAGEPAVISQACQLFLDFYHSPDAKPFQHDFTASVFEIAVRNGPKQNHTRVREMYEDSQRWRLSEDHRMAALGAMACSSDEQLMRDTLEYAMTDRVLPQDLNLVIGFMVTSDHRSKHVLWQWFCENYQRVVDRLGECSALLGHVVGTVIGDFASEEMAQAVQSWFADKRTMAFDRTLPQSLEFIRVRAAWYARDCDDVRRWFSEKRDVVGL